MKPEKELPASQRIFLQSHRHYRLQAAEQSLFQDKQRLIETPTVTSSCSFLLLGLQSFLLFYEPIQENVDRSDIAEGKLEKKMLLPILLHSPNAGSRNTLKMSIEPF